MKIHSSALLVVLFSMSLFSLLQSLLHATPPANEAILTPDSKAYRKRISNFRYTEDQARQLIREATKGREGVYFDYKPLFVVSNEFFFGLGEKTSLPLTGYYFDGMTGTIVYRKSKFKVSGRVMRIPENAFDFEDTIREASVPPNRQ